MLYVPPETNNKRVKRLLREGVDQTEGSVVVERVGNGAVVYVGYVSPVGGTFTLAHTLIGEVYLDYVFSDFGEKNWRLTYALVEHVMQNFPGVAAKLTTPDIPPQGFPLPTFSSSRETEASLPQEAGATLLQEAGPSSLQEVDLSIPQEDLSLPQDADPTLLQETDPLLSQETHPNSSQTIDSLFPQKEDANSSQTIHPAYLQASNPAQAVDPAGTQLSLSQARDALSVQAADPPRSREAVPFRRWGWDPVYWEDEDPFNSY